jgi:protein-disulfide isomerase
MPNDQMRSTPLSSANRSAPPRLDRTQAPTGGAHIILTAGVILAAALFGSTAAWAQARLKNAGLARSAEALAAPVKSYGSSSAPIRMDVFTDYACPMCRNLYLQTLRPMIADYVSSGRVYLVHHDYPLEIPGHENSSQAARWANVAAEFGQFEAVETALYTNQESWATSGDIAKYVSGAMSASDFRRIAKVMETCQAPGPRGRPGAVDASPHPCAIDTYIERDIAFANQIPVQATPTYVITYKGQRLPPGSGFVSWPVLKQFFDSLLRP